MFAKAAEISCCSYTIFQSYSDSPENSGRQYCTVSLYPVADSAAANKLSLLNTLIHIAYSLRYAIYFIAAGSLIGAIVCMVALMHAAGRRPDSEEIYPGPLSVIPFDLMLAACAAVTAGLCFIGSEMGNGGIPFVLFVILAILIIMSLILGLCMSMAGRVKRHVLLKGTLCFLILRLIWKGLRGLARLIARLHLFNRSLFRGLPLVWKTALIIAGLTILEIAVLSSFDFDAIIAVWVIEKAVLVPAALYFMLTLRRLQKSGAALAAGDLSYHTDTHGMFWDLKQHGEHLNSIASGMSIAVEDRLKSERMKTELITNVSHDIKTPLTSIINYASLIGNEPCENAVIKEYSAVLVRQSEKLKRLIEDLVEASKASTGNLEVHISEFDASVFVGQIAGEYEDKLAEHSLKLITDIPDKPVRILADSRMMWRIFDNLMNNVAKYAQPDTRVYFSLEKISDQAVFTIKNTSRDPLNISEEELMERFTRGDRSRNTEGNGLGLSIARSMAELQKGSLNLSIDGDLFKAILRFPIL